MITKSWLVCHEFEPSTTEDPPCWGAIHVKSVKSSNLLPLVIDLILTSHCSATRGLLETDHVILNHGQVTWTTPELAPPSPNYHTTPMGGRFSSRQI
ncbi:hypothetical protein TNCV_1486021 [Trichonephila clavipes]|nr:hypothetical protein TNCV_1486021 [Trichonephila clavipes]